MILATAASFNPCEELLEVISARVSRNVFASRVQAGPMSCKILDIPTDDSGPSDGDTLLATPDASPLREFELLLIVIL